MRILVTVSPLMYREVVALSIHERRPDFEVLIAPPWPVDGRTGRFGPHVLVHDAEEAGGLVCRVEVLYAEGMGTRVSFQGGRSFTIEDTCMDDLLSLVDEAEVSASSPRAEV